MLDADVLRTFVAIAETGSFTRAAEEVHKTQSAVSMQMKKLEEQVGRPLFERAGRSIRLSRDGLRLLDYAQRLVRLNQEAVAAFTDPQLQGSVMLGLPDDYDRLLPPVLSAFARTHPHVELAVQCLGSVDLKAEVDKGTIDIAIVTLCDITAPGHVVRQEKLHWVAGQGHGAYLCTPLPLAVGPQNCIWRRSAMEALDRAGIGWRIAYSSSSATALCSAVTAGLAVAILPGKRGAARDAHPRREGRLPAAAALRDRDPAGQARDLADPRRAGRPHRLAHRQPGAAGGRSRGVAVSGSRARSSRSRHRSRAG